MPDEDRTTPPMTRPSMLVPSAPQTGLLPRKGPSGLRRFRLSSRRHVQKAMAAPMGNVGSTDADIHADLQMPRPAAQTSCSWLDDLLSWPRANSCDFW